MGKETGNEWKKVEKVVGKEMKDPGKRFRRKWGGRWGGRCRRRWGKRWERRVGRRCMGKEMEKEMSLIIHWHCSEYVAPFLIWFAARLYRAMS
jgi:hypothetical protein